MIRDVLLLVGLGLLARVVWKIGGWWVFYLSARAEQRRDVRRHLGKEWPEWIKDMEDEDRR